MKMPVQKPGRSKQNYATPDDFITAVKSRFGELDFDLAASPTNAKSEAFFTKRQDALQRLWVGETPNRSFTFWLNPPYLRILRWVKKCALERHQLTTGQILVLLPASTGSNWFRDHVWNEAAIYFLNGRVCFIDGEPYPKDLILLRYRSPRYPVAHFIWDWKRNVLGTANERIKR